MGSKIRQKNVKIHKDFELYQVFMHNFLHQNVSNIYYFISNIYYSKKELKHFDLDTLVLYGILTQNIIASIHLYFYVLNCFKYIQIYILV